MKRSKSSADAGIVDPDDDEKDAVEEDARAHGVAPQRIYGAAAASSSGIYTKQGFESARQHPSSGQQDTNGKDGKHGDADAKEAARRTERYPTPSEEYVSVAYRAYVPR